jgi:FkbM family methyltransferase
MNFRFIENTVLKILRKINPAYHPSKTSWAQQGEDLIIDFLFTQFLDCKVPSYLDIGANHPYHLSNTYFFYQKGSRGVNVEPDPSLIQNFQRLRKNDITLNVGVGPEQGNFDFFIMSSPTLNTFSKETAEEYSKSSHFGYPVVKKVVNVPVVTANEILEKYFSINPNYFISIDVEGLDFQILQSIDLEKFKPPVICIEINGKDEKLVKNYLHNKGYLLYANNSTNCIFILKEKFLFPIYDSNN